MEIIMNSRGPGGNVRLEAEKLRRRKQEIMRRRRRADFISLTIMGSVFAAVVLLNLFQFNRPTESEVEKRKLASFPTLTYEALVSGEFTDGINKFFADTFVFREKIVSASKKLDSLMGYDFAIDGKGSFVLLDSGSKNENKDDGSGISNILDNLNSGDTTDTQPEDTTAPDDTTSTSPDEPKLTISKTTLTLTVGSGAELVASGLEEGAEYEWSVADDSLLSITAKGEKVTLKALSEGQTVVTLKSGEDSLECKIKIEKISSGGVDNGGTADFMTNGLFIYGDAVYTQCWYSPEHSSNYARTVEYYKQIFPNATVSACVIPTSAIKIDNAEINAKLQNQEEIFAKLDEIIGAKVNFVNPYSEMYAHRDEYIYFRSDHHWTQRGAYYAYKAFVESVGLEAATLEDFNIIELTDSYSGSMYEYTKDDRVKQFKDTVEAFMSKKTLTMTITDRSGNVSTYNEAIMEWSKSYSAFLCGDNPYTVINVPENPQDRNILVLKDSYGNAFVPFLAENYGNIFVVDTRYTEMNVKEMFADYDLTDILFINNLEAANSPAWTQMYLKAAGVAVD